MITIDVGYWASLRSKWLDVGQVFFSMFMDMQKNPKRTKPISSYLDRTSLINKRFIIWKKKSVFLWDTGVSSSRQESAILPSQIANHRQHRIQFILSSHRASHIIMAFINCHLIMTESTTLILSILHWSLWIFFCWQFLLQVFSQ